jgi:uncharacterized repeat protein (TIGR01451 family)
MGRRLSLIFVMMLLASPVIPVARAQGDGKGSPAPEAVAPAPPEPISLPVDFTAAEEPADPVKNPKPETKAKPKEPAPSPKAKLSDPATKPKPATGNRPSLATSPGDPKRTAPKDDERPVGSPSNLALETPASLEQPPARSAETIPPIDQAVTLTEGPDKQPPAAPSPANGPAPAAGGTKPLPGAPTGTPPSAGLPPAGDAEPSLSTDHIPLGPQTVAVTVDVLAPKSMNLNQEANLRIVVRNGGNSEAINVKVLDELPEGLEYKSSQPAANVASQSLLSWSFPALLQTASRAQTQVFKPQLKVDQTVSKANVLKGQPVEFKIGVTNTGDGPARNVTIRARLSPGLRHGTDGKNDEQMLELTIPSLGPNQREELDPLLVAAIQGGDQSCTVTALSPDVLPFVKEEAESIKTVTVVHPELKIAISAPEKRFTDTIATYEVRVENPGTAPARRVRLIATLPVNGRLMEAKGGRYDSATRRLQWSFDQIEAGGSQTRAFSVRMGGVGFYEVLAVAQGDGNLKATESKSTRVEGMPDVDLVVSEQLRVVDVGGRTTFQIRLRNYGTKEATNVKMKATLSKNLEAEESADVPPGIVARTAPGPDSNEVLFVDEKGNGIKSLGPGKQIVMGIIVKVTGADPKVATCKVSVTHDDLTDPFEDMARIKVMPSRGTPTSNP